MRYRRFYLDNQCDDELCQYFPQAIGAERYPMASDHQLARALFQYPTLFNGMGLRLGTPVDIRKAMRYYQKAAVQGHAGVLCNVACFSVSELQLA